MNLNKVLILGRVTANPELRHTPGGQSVSSFSIATNRVWTDKVGAKQEETEFHNVVAWGRQAEVASQFLTKGALVLIEGRLRTRTWQDKQGVNHKATEIITERMQLGPRPAGQGQGTWNKGQEGWSGSKKQETRDMGQGEQDESKLEEIPVITLDDSAGGDGEVKPEDLPF